MPRRDAAVTMLLVAATILVFGVMADHAAMARVQRVDDAFLRTMVEVRTAWLTGVARLFDQLGRVYVTLPVRLLIAAFLISRRRWWHLAAFASAMALSEIAIGSLKALYGRPRPPPALALVHTGGGSFPSGHAVAASVIVVAAVIALFPEGPRRYVWGAAAVGFSLLMAVSRAYLAAHWISDAVAGVLLGTSIALGTAFVVHHIRSRRDRPRLPDAPPPLPPDPSRAMRGGGSGPRG